MTEVTLQLDPVAAAFYKNVAAAAEKPLEQVLSDALFRLAGELSLQSLRNQSVRQD